MQRALREADAFVLPVVGDPILNITDGVPVALMEAMAVGLPVVSARTAGIPELIDDGTSGFLAKPGDSTDFATVIGCLFELSVLERAKIAQAAREKIVADHDIEKRTKDLYSSLLKLIVKADGQLARSLVMSRPIILTFVEYYLPGFKSGGPIRSIANMVEALGDEFEFRIVTSDRDSLDVAPYYGITSDMWMCVRKAWVYYVSPERRRLFAWARLIRETPHDVLYLNSLFNPAYTLLPLLARRLAGSQRKPVIVAPRGEFSTGALGLKRWKKRPFLAVAQLAGLYRNVLWHASTEDEAQLIRRQFGGAAKIMIAIMIASDLPPMSGQQPTACEAIDASGRLRIVFLSRISRMKNLDYALRVLAKTRVQIQFDIWGTLEDPAYWNTCQDQIRSLPENVVARYRGVADHSEVNKILADYDLLFLPTRGENYGHVIAEAVSAGTPVLLSDQTPWRNLHIEGVGWDLPLENGEAAFLEAIEEALHKVELGRVAWRQRVLDFATDRLHDPSLLEANRALFLQAVADKV